VQRELVLRARDGDAEAFGTLARCAMGRLHRVAYGILRDQDAADDATQRALIDAWDHLGGLSDPDRFEAWTYRLVVRTALKEIRRERSQLARVRLIDAAGTTVEVGDGSSRTLDRDELDRAFRRISPELRATVVLHFLADLPVATVAEILDIPAGTVASRCHHAVRQLRRVLEQDAVAVPSESWGSHVGA
jgi:RNA polymerase sigma-70 factor (ECF subfamily)